MRALFFALFAATSFSLAAENVWTLGEYDKRLGWALISGDGKVTLRLEGDVKSDLPKGIARLKGDKKSLVSGGGSVDLTSLSNVGTGWPPFHDARSLKEVVWRAKPPPFSVLKRIFNGVPCVLNSAKEGKKCIIRVPADDEEWQGLISPFELCERDYAPSSCEGVLFASSRKAWVVLDKDL